MHVTSPHLPPFDHGLEEGVRLRPPTVQRLRLDLVRILGRQPHAGRRPQGQARDMCLGDAHDVHERGDVVREKLAGIDSFGFVAVTSPAEVDGEAGKMLGVLGHLKGIAARART